jgi:hypothetical protein
MSILLHPRLLRAAEMDPLLDSMIDRGCPLNRETWVDLMWGADIPKPWTVEHEMDVPEFWQNLDLVEDDGKGELQPQQTLGDCNLRGTPPLV